MSRWCVWIFGALATTACAVEPMTSTGEPLGGANDGDDPQVAAIAPATSFTLTLSVTGNGMLGTEGTGLNCNVGTCTFSIAANTVVRVHAVSGTGSTFVTWSGDCSGFVPICGVRMTRNFSIGGTFSP